MDDLIYKNEGTLFVVAAVISIIFWLALILGTLGIALIYILFFFLFYLFAHSALISYLKGTAVQIAPSQFPDLYQQIEACCKKVGVDQMPETYLLHADGAFNAFATRFLRRNFIVLFSDIVDALKDQPEALNFYIGHELGHIHRKHLIWGPILMPSLVLPLLGAAYSRAREYTCDNYGYACCADPQHAIAGLAALSAGAERWKTLKVERYIMQAEQTGGFWMSFNELISDYPWLVKRMARIVYKSRKEPVILPRRNLFAWILAVFVPRSGYGGGGSSFLVTIAIIGILAAIAIPNFIAYRQKAMQAKFGGAGQGRSEYQFANNMVKMELQQIYQLQKDYYETNGEYIDDLQKLEYTPISEGVEVEIVSADKDCFEAVAADMANEIRLSVNCKGLPD